MPNRFSRRPPPRRAGFFGGLLGVTEGVASFKQEREFQRDRARQRELEDEVRARQRIEDEQRDTEIARERARRDFKPDPPEISGGGSTEGTLPPDFEFRGTELEGVPSTPTFNPDPSQQPGGGGFSPETGMGQGAPMDEQRPNQDALDEFTIRNGGGFLPGDENARSGMAPPRIRVPGGTERNEVFDEQQAQEELIDALISTGRASSRAHAQLILADEADPIEEPEAPTSFEQAAAAGIPEGATPQEVADIRREHLRRTPTTPREAMTQQALSPDDDTPGVITPEEALEIRNVTGFPPSRAAAPDSKPDPERTRRLRSIEATLKSAGHAVDTEEEQTLVEALADGMTSQQILEDVRAALMDAGIDEQVVARELERFVTILEDLPEDDFGAIDRVSLGLPERRELDF